MIRQEEEALKIRCIVLVDAGAADGGGSSVLLGVGRGPPAKGTEVVEVRGSV